MAARLHHLLVEVEPQLARNGRRPGRGVVRATVSGPSRFLATIPGQVVEQRPPVVIVD
jgi:hypothetical protein